MMDPIKVQGVADWPVPHNVTGCQILFGVHQFLSHFISQFSEVAKPLNALLSKGCKMGMDKCPIQSV